MKTRIAVFTFIILSAALVGGCQSMKQDAHQRIDEWIDLSGVGVYWNQIPADHRRTGVTRFVLGKNKAGYNSYGDCEPSPRMWYPHSKESIDSSKELFWFAAELGWWVAVCNANSNQQRYRLGYQSMRWVLARWREAGLRPTDQQRADVFCGVDGNLRRYKQHNPGRPVDTDVLDFLKDNPCQMIGNAAIKAPLSPNRSPSAGAFHSHLLGIVRPCACKMLYGRP